MNPTAGHESTLLKIEPKNEEPQWFLIDAGEDVSPDSFLDDGQSLNGVFLTHAHSDHYASLSSILSSNEETELFTSAGTATILEQVHTEANQYRKLGDVESISEALTPLETWTSVSEYVDVLPISAGHAPGAVSFLFRIDDIPGSNQAVTILATGDFTTRALCGSPGLAIPDGIDIDIMIPNVAMTEDFDERFTEALGIIIERTLSGSQTLVATGALTGVHTAYVLGYLIRELDREFEIHIVGQTAKLYSALGFEAPFVVSHPEFEHTEEVLSSGAVTISGPEKPSQGSTRRLFGVIQDDPGAAFVQLTTSGSEIVTNSACSTYGFELSNHPSEDQLRSFIDENYPRHLIFKHASTEKTKKIGSSFDALLHWQNDDTLLHVLYNDGDWITPAWMGERDGNRILMRNYRQTKRLLLDHPLEELPTPSKELQTSDVQAEGVIVERLKEQFQSTQIQTTDTGESQSLNTEPTFNENGSSRTTSVDNDDSKSESSDTVSDSEETFAEPKEDAVFQTDIENRLRTIESSIETILSNTVIDEKQTEQTGSKVIEARFDTLEAKLDTVSGKLSDDSTLINAKVISQDDLVLLRVNPTELDKIDANLSQNQEVRIQITETGISE